MLRAGHQIVERHFHHDGGVLRSAAGVLPVLFQGGVQHVQRDIGDRAKTAALDQDRAIVQHLGWLHHLPIGQEHGHIRKPLFHQLQAHQPVVHTAENRAGEFDQVDLHPAPVQPVHQALDQRSGILQARIRAVDQVDAGQADRLLLARREGVQHFNVNDDLGRLRPGTILETDAEPPMAAGRTQGAVRRYGIGEDEESGVRAPLCVQLFDELAVLAIQHRLQPRRGTRIAAAPVQSRR